MVLPKRLARFNRIFTNRVLGLLTPRLPYFGTIIHNGRRSGRTYRTPVNVFRVPEGYVVALTYGSDSDWVRNVLAAEGCELVTRGRTIKLTQPRIVHDEKRSAMPLLVRLIIGLAGVTEFLYLQPA
ncbi:nitroreductase family deazaflavin-dependent oxidoreductase [Amycolatopsis taiwanensis]|uniref:nitroreductase family deazaflavin-dependent oxidoreductase n=1 Tax=Amycolatopsis taiwanensis TaxID=342230 RepID=UPI0004845EED|nr:nitroreductase family deazaflavin-dependent oxidoreductase [Amycolatopsis taiwanensis]